MSSGNWLNNDQLYLKFGTSKAVPSTTGEFETPTSGGLRVIEGLIDLTTLNTSTATILEDNLKFPTGMLPEQVELFVETAATGATATLSIGLMKDDRSTSLSDTAFVNAVAVATLTPAGTKLIINVGSTGAGGYLGQTVNPTEPGYLTAKAGTAVFSAGKVRYRILYRSNAVITQ
jgi:hypothetical protein